MFALKVTRTFSAAHALLIRDQRETLHSHDWRVTLTLAGEALDPDGLLCDFHDIEAALNAIIAPFHNANLNEIEPFTTRNPSAEHVAQHIAQSISSRLPGNVRIESVAVTEAPGCEAIYRPSF